MSASHRVELPDAGGAKIGLPDGRPALVAFAKRDCPTCLLAFPVFRALHAAYGEAIDFAWIAQDEDGGAEWSAEAGSLAILDDRALDATCRFDPEAVPTLFLIGADGQLRGSWTGFARSEWRELSDRIATENQREPASVSWETLPELRPGCGSRHLDPTVAAQLEMPPGAERLTARRLSLAEGEDAHEFLAARGLADGLPVVPPTPARVLQMLSGTRLAATDIVATVPPNLVPVSVEKVAINAVMAGCLPTYMPTLIAALRAVCSESFNLHGVLATTFFSSPILIVNGPVRDAIGIGYGGNCLGQGNRANLSIGRAVQLIVQNVGGGRPGGIDRAVLGQPGKTSFCFGEHEARSRWEPLHVERGFA
ncbi:MAG: TlpA family protein disulfide reductase, partial [Myxococcales bacterium]|nr:TlpA family protein disulfide reductase [Myxococcales bacterium]